VLVPETRPRGTEATRRFVQEKLTQLGYDAGPADGQLGGKTREAILAFQARIGQVSRGSELTRCLVDRLAIEAARNAP
jgi:peptidoglycan hydrolase-like protein with peptidoglycan-binding domain